MGSPMDETNVKEDLDTVVARFLPMIKKIAKRLRSRSPNVAADDLQQAGAIGLLKAMQRYDQYDPSQSQLATWVHPWIKGEMLMHLRKDTSSRRYEREATRSKHRRRAHDGQELTELVFEVADMYACDAQSFRTPEEALLTRESLECVDEFYAELSERDREFIRLRYTEHLTLEEIGLAVGRSRAALCRLEQRLREQLIRRMDRGG